MYKSKAKIGIHTMKAEHFGISIVEMMVKYFKFILVLFI